MVKNCDLGLENAALGLRPRAVFSRPRSQFFAIRTSQPANNIYIRQETPKKPNHLFSSSEERGLLNAIILQIHIWAYELEKCSQYQLFRLTLLIKLKATGTFFFQVTVKSRLWELQVYRLFPHSGSAGSPQADRALRLGRVICIRRTHHKSIMILDI